MLFIKVEDYILLKMSNNEYLMKIVVINLNLC